MTKFDRVMQKEILELCAMMYPYPAQFLAYVLPSIEPLINSEFKIDSERKIKANLFYLRDHGLIDFIGNRDSYYLSILEEMTATCKGIDFIRNDGGLSAILNVQTVRLHRDTVVVLEDLINLSGMNTQDKEKAKSLLGELSLEALKSVVQAAINAGLKAIS
ncbi:MULTISPECIES: hypothetical protein [unclassified Cedecea]